MVQIQPWSAQTPVALSYMIDEGLLPPNPDPVSYFWTTHTDSSDGIGVEEEVLVTQDAVAYSHGQFVRNIYRFQPDGDPIIQALLTRFPLGQDGGIISQRQTTSSDQRLHPTESATWLPTHVRDGNPARETRPDINLNDRMSAPALVIIMRTKAQVFFLEGSHHIIDLPFEVERAFATSRGIIMQRKITPTQPDHDIPAFLRAPPNSFVSSQTIAQSQHSTLGRDSFIASEIRNETAGSDAGAHDPLEMLFDTIKRNLPAPEEEEIASVFVLTNPLDSLGVACLAKFENRYGSLDRRRTDDVPTFSLLNQSEKVVFVKSIDASSGNDDASRELILLATMNALSSQLTFWHAWYIEPTTLHTIMEKRNAQNSVKARRRSSFMSVNIATGTTTPAPRPRDNPRESFMGNLRSTKDLLPGTRSEDKQDEAALMTSRMDPDFSAATVSRDTRRVSGMMADGRSSTNAASANFVPASSRRPPSVNTKDRRSFGLRKSRISMTGSNFNQHVAIEDTTMELDSDLGDVNDETSSETVCELMSAVQEVAGIDSILGNGGDGFRRGLVLRKLHTLHVPRKDGCTGDSALSTSIALVEESRTRSVDDDHFSFIIVHDLITKEVKILDIVVKQGRIGTKSSNVPVIPIPFLVKEESIGVYPNIIHLRDENVGGVLLGNNSLLLLSHGRRTIVQVPLQSLCRRFASPSQSISQAGTSGIKSTDDSSHDWRRTVALRPPQASVEKLLRACQSVIQPPLADMMQVQWLLAKSSLVVHPAMLAYTEASSDFLAVVSAIFAMVLPLLTSEARSAIKGAKSKLVGNPSLMTLTRPQARRTWDESRPDSAWEWTCTQISGTEQHDRQSSQNPCQSTRQSELFLVVAAILADETAVLPEFAWLSGNGSIEATNNAMNLMLALHIYREEQKLNVLHDGLKLTDQIAFVIAQLGSWLGLDGWTLQAQSYYDVEIGTLEGPEFIISSPDTDPIPKLMDEPVGVLQWVEFALANKSTEQYPLLSTIAGMDVTSPLTNAFKAHADSLTPRLRTLTNILSETCALTKPVTEILTTFVRYGMDREMLDTLPDGISIPFRETLAQCERIPPIVRESRQLKLIGREDLGIVQPMGTVSLHPAVSGLHVNTLQAVCSAIEQPTNIAKSKEADRHAISQLIFSEDRRLVEAVALMHYVTPQLGECQKSSDWSDAEYFDMQRRVAQWITTRMIALPTGDGMIHFDSQTPLLTEKYHLAGFSSTCVIQPIGHTLTIDRTGLSEDKVNWAYFHAGASAGFRISRNASGIDTSWIAFNKPSEPTHRHAGLLLALGLNGHLRTLAKWLAFKYLTKKHDMTSIGLLLGLSASYMGSMDSLITRMLSVHITRMLPAGAAELNISPLMQTAGLMGIGLLYYSSQHRRMSEMMLSELEHLETEDRDDGPDQLRDESYRLAAGFALGYINLGKGRNLQGMSGTRLPERLLVLAVGPRPVPIVHVFDRATAGAIMAISLIYMKSRDSVMARKIDVPDSATQFDHVRPDVLLLRAMAKHLILWDSMTLEPYKNTSWIQINLPACYQSRLTRTSHETAKSYPVTTSDMPFYNIVTGLAWALSLRYAGSHNIAARDEICLVMDHLHGLRERGEYLFDAKLARATIRRCIDVCAVAAATVMAGSGDLRTFRYLRRLHGRTDAETPYGSHLAAHMGIGLLFLGGGTFTLATTNLATASLLCALYPLYPVDVQDNRCHLQAFRHLWVFAAQARCMVVEDIDTRRLISMPIVVGMLDGTTRYMTAPCLLPDLDSIAQINTNDTSYRRVTLDFARDPTQRTSFRRNQHICVRNCPAGEAYSSVFGATLAALNEAQNSSAVGSIWNAIFKLETFQTFDQVDIELVLPPDLRSSVYATARGTVVDDCLALAKYAKSVSARELWNLRLIFGWAERMKSDGQGKLKWIGYETVEELKATIERRSRSRVA